MKRKIETRGEIIDHFGMMRKHKRQLGDIDNEQGGYSQNFLSQILKIFVTLTWI